MKIKGIFWIAILFVFSSTLNAQDEARLLRFPTIYENQVVFTYAGDLYTASTDGGLARRLSSHDGFEMFAKFSPDGQTIAFTGQYDGNTEVFTMPAQGGEPVRLTNTATLGRDDVGDRMGPNNLVMGWTPDGESIVFRSRKQTFNPFKGHLFTVSKKGGLSEQLPFSVAGFCSYSADGKKIAYNKVFREFRTWKYYKGGMADDIRIFDFETKKTEIITDDPGQDIFPMWAGSKIYFLSDRDRTMNLFAYDTETKQTTKVTDYKEFDIKFPSLGKNAIVYENGGYIYRLDLKNQQSQKIEIFIQNDMVVGRDELKSISGSMSSMSMSPNGERLAVTARGELFNIPVKEGISRNISQSPEAHDRGGDWSPDGKHIAYISDKSGEFEIYMQKSDDPDNEKVLTKKTSTYIFGFSWSPDSKKMLYHDKKFKLWLLDIESGKKTLVDESGQGPIGDYSWSHDSKWIAYVNPALGMNQISLYSVESGKSSFVTDNWYQSGSPAFTRDGKYLAFSSSRSFSPTYSQTEWNHAYQDMNKLYMIPLAKDTKNPLGLTDDKVKLPSDEKEKKPEAKKDSKDEKAEEKPEMKVDLEGIQDRIIGLPVAAGNYFNIQCLDSKIFYIYMSSKSRDMSLKSYDLTAKKETDHGSKLNYLISSNGKKMMLIQGSKLSVVGIPAGKASMGKTVSLSGLQLKLDKKAEWAQIFDESWRQMRDFFYDPGMHGVDWKAIYKKYKPLVAHVQHRTDLSYIIGEMIAELSVGHAYVNNGEHPMPKRIQTGLLGAVIESDPSGYFKIKEILRGANWSPKLRSPLTEIGVDAKEGDYIISVNGISTKSTIDVYSLLIGQAGKTVELGLSNNADDKDIRKILIKPIADESSLYYYKFVQTNTQKVSDATDGQVGYIHIPDMGVTGLNEFIEHYYPQLTKKALIIDDRGNGGGNVSPMIIERLKREITYATMHTNQKNGQVNPVGTMAGPKVALIDQYSASDGDLFPYRFKHNNTVIGVRTWGGVVGYSGSIPCMDGGSIITPSYGPYAADGSGFIIEGHGVEPDIEVHNDPYDEFMGIDKQLDKAIEVIMEQLKTYNKTVPPIPKFPVKNK